MYEFHAINVNQPSYLKQVNNGAIFRGSRKLFRTYEYDFREKASLFRIFTHNFRGKSFLFRKFIAGFREFCFFFREPHQQGRFN